MLAHQPVAKLGIGPADVSCERVATLSFVL
jgi:hypothetical protein